LTPYVVYHYHHYHRILIPKETVKTNSKHNRAARKSQDQQTAWLPGSMCQIPSKRRTDEETRLSVRPFVCLLCLSVESVLWRNEPRCFIEI